MFKNKVYDITRYIFLILYFYTSSVYAKYTEEQENICLDLGGKVITPIEGGKIYENRSACDFGNGIIADDLSYNPTIDDFRCELIASKLVPAYIQDNTTVTGSPRFPTVIGFTFRRDYINSLSESCMQDIRKGGAGLIKIKTGDLPDEETMQKWYKINLWGKDGPLKS